MAIPIGNPKGVPSTERKNQVAAPAQKDQVKRSRAQTGPTDRVGRLTGREAEASSTPNFAAWGKGPQPAKEKRLTLPEGMLLSDGSRGSKVKGLQYMLNKHGEELKKDGIFGPKTLDAVRKFQQEHGLKVDGIVGPKTLKELNGKPRPDAKGESKTGPKPEPRPQPEAPTQTRPESRPQPQPRPETPTQSRPESRPEAQTQPRPQPDPQAQAKPEFGLSPKTLAALQKSGKLDVLRKLPPEVAGRYEQLSPKMRQTMFEKLSGSTWGNSHREAFVKGTVMGMNTFNYISDQIQQKVASGEMSKKDGDGLRADMQRMARLTPQQRDAIAEMFILQGGR